MTTYLARGRRPLERIISGAGGWWRASTLPAIVLAGCLADGAPDDERTVEATETIAALPLPLNPPATAAVAPPRRMTADWVREFPGREGAEHDMLAVDAYGRAHVLLVTWAWGAPDSGGERHFHPVSFEWAVLDAENNLTTRDPGAYFGGQCYFGLTAVHDDVVLSGSGMNIGFGFEAMTLGRVAADGGPAGLFWEPVWGHRHIDCLPTEAAHVEAEGSWLLARDGMPRTVPYTTLELSAPFAGGLALHSTRAEQGVSLDRAAQVMADGSVVVLDFETSAETSTVRWFGSGGATAWTATGMFSLVTATADGLVYAVRTTPTQAEVVIFDALGNVLHEVPLPLWPHRIHVDAYDRGLVLVGGEGFVRMQVAKVSAAGVLSWHMTIPHTADQIVRSVTSAHGMVYLAGSLGLRGGWFAAVDSADGTIRSLDTVATFPPEISVNPPHRPLESTDPRSTRAIDAQVEVSPDGTAVYAAFSSTGGTKLVRYVADRDEDGIPDRWEEEDCIPYPAGCFYIGDRYDLDPDHKDLIVELDMMERPLTQTWTWTAALQKVRQAFAAAPVHNPDGTTGIRLHLDTHESNLPRAPWTDVPPPGQPFVEFDTFRDANFGRAGDGPFEREALARIVRYGVVADVLVEYQALGGLAELEGNDFMLFPRSASFTQRHAHVKRLPAAEQADAWNRWLAAELMHELGHTLGLRHGGGAGVGAEERDVHHKPNYHSVMNYMWIHPETELWPYLEPDYSTGRNRAIDEVLFDERIGFGGVGEHKTHPVVVRSYLRDEEERFPGMIATEGGQFDADQNIEYSTAGPIDWDDDGGCQSSWECGTECGYDVNNDSRCMILHDHDDWSFLSFRLSTSAGWSESWSEEHGTLQLELEALAQAAERSRERCEQPHGPEAFCPCPTEGAQQVCGTDEGACVAGLQTCVADNWTECVGDVSRRFEVCDGLDNDCNGMTDEGFTTPDGTCTVGTGACERPGAPVCTGADGAIVCTGEPGPPAAETCGDGIDDDCDGVADNGCATLLRPLAGAVTGSPHATGASLAVKPLRPTFVWTAVPGSTSYQLEATTACTAVATCDFSAVTLTAFPTEATFTPTFDLPVALSPPVGARYTWRVRPCSAAGCGAWSSPSYVDVGRQLDDFDGDGYGDLVAGMRMATGAHAYVYRGSAAGIDVATRRVVPTIGSIVAVGDINGDGYADALSAEAGYGTSGGGHLTPNLGRVAVMFGSSGGLDAIGVSPERATFVGGQINGLFGGGVARAGDVDGDGYGDFVVGQPSLSSPAVYPAGRVHLIRGAATGAQFRRSVYAAEGLPDTADLGEEVTGGGDVDGDGLADLFATEPAGGLIYRLRLDRGTGALVVASIIDLAPAEHTAGFGAAAVMGDVNGDGLADLVVGDRSTATPEERIHVWYGSAGGLTDHAVLVDPSGQANTGWGPALAVADYGADGRDDILVGAPLYDLPDIAADVGRRVFLRGTAAGLVVGSARVSPYVTNASRFGVTVGWVDGNGDGYPEVVVGAPRMDTHLTDVGAVLVSTLNPATGNTVSTQFIEGTAADGILGRDVD